MRISFCLLMTLFVFMFATNPIAAQVVRPKVKPNLNVKPNVKPNPDGGEFIKEQPADFKAPKISVAKAGKAKVIPGSYVFLVNPETVPSFNKKNAQFKRQFNSRDTRKAAFQKHDKEARKAIMKIAQETMGIAPGQIQHIYTGGISGFSVKMSNEQAKKSQQRFKSAKSKAIVAGGPDFEMSINASAPQPMAAPEAEAMKLAQYPSWGANWTGYATYNGYYWAWIIDTGIDLDHPDLNVKTSWGRSFVGYTNSANDDDGHGTHVAGIVAARNNGIGTVGVAAGAGVVPVKVLNSSGSGAWSDVLAGFNYAAGAAWSGDVINLSLGGTAPSAWEEFWGGIFGDDRLALENAIRDAGANGIYVTIAAGNENRHANQATPARVNGTKVYTISAMDSGRRIASFSNYGNGPVDYAAPGVSIRSTYIGGGYAYMDGTSMAAPFVAGIILSNGGTIRTNGRLVTDKDSNRDPLAVK